MRLKISTYLVDAALLGVDPCSIFSRSAIECDSEGVDAYTAGLDGDG